MEALELLNKKRILLKGIEIGRDIECNAGKVSELLKVFAKLVRSQASS